MSESDSALSRAGWIIRVDPPTATMGSEKKLYSLPKMPSGLFSTAAFNDLNKQDALTVQACIDNLRSVKNAD